MSQKRFSANCVVLLSIQACFYAVDRTTTIPLECA